MKPYNSEVIVETFKVQTIQNDLYKVPVIRMYLFGTISTFVHFE